MFYRWEVQLLVICCVVYVFGEDGPVLDDVTTLTPNLRTTLQHRSKENKEDLLEKALIAKRRKKGKFDRFNMRHLENAAQQEYKRANNFRHRDRQLLRDREYLSRRVNTHRTLITPKERKPNIILILTDDQDVELGSLNFMPRTVRLLRDGGAEFRHAYVTTPMCCPSRSSLLTGMYVHNHNVYTNNENCSSHAWQRTHETRTFATYLSNAGYRTGYFGKYLNKYNGSYVPAGWREWGGLIMNSRYYNYSINLNGRKVRHGDDYERDYYTDLIANDSVSFLRQSKQYFSRKPVMLVLSFPAPHGPEDSAPQFSDMFFNVTTHHTPAYDFAPNPDKQWILQVTKKMNGVHKQFTDLLMTKRLQTLQSVDIAVERIYQELKHIGELDNTYIVYTSDHGYHLGQFGLIKGKSFPFEFDVRVPFLVRGPNIQPGTVVDDVVLNIDLAPTFLDMAGVDTPPHMDGRSIMKLLHPPRGNRRLRWPDTFLIESSGRREIPEVKPKVQPSYVGEVSPNSSEPGNNATDVGSGGGSDDSLEADADDTEDEAAHDAIPGPNEDLAQDNKIPGGLPKPSLMSEECKRGDMQLPCQMGQKWFCVYDGARWRKHKCRPHSCACFTQQGYFYTRPMQPGDDIRMDSSLLHMLHGRRRRDVDAGSLDNIEDIVDDLDAELDDAQKTEVSLQNSTLWQCSVNSRGTVNCSDVVYSDYPTWKKTRDRTETKIRQLKSHLAALKNLRKHLRERRPSQDHHWNATTPSHPTTIWNTTFLTTTVSEEDEGTTLAAGYTTPGAELTTTLKTESRWDNRIEPVRSMHDTCFCSSSTTRIPSGDGKEAMKEARRRLKEEKIRKRERKSRKKARMEKECLSEKMNCFTHDNEHWRTPPLWTEGPFCFCMNANNNTYSCLRTINATHNFLYCEFVTGLVTFYNVRIDPFEQLNRIGTLSLTEKSQLSEQLADLKSCRGTKECTLGNHIKWQ